MESGSSGPQSPAPGGDDDPKGPQSPSGGTPPPPPAGGGWAPPAGSQPPPAAPSPPEGNQPPPPPGTQASPPGGQAPPFGSQAPPPPPGPQSPQSPPFGGGQMPPGGWQQPVAQQPFVPAQGQLASWGSRLGAYLLDGLIVLVVLAVGVGIIVGAASISSALGVVVGILLGLAMLVFLLGYGAILEARDGEVNGQTWGKQAVGIRVVRDNGQPMDLGSALLRELVLKGLAVGIASSIIPIIPWFLNYFWPLWDDTDRALHDMACKTHVVRV